MHTLLVTDVSRRTGQATRGWKTLKSREQLLDRVFRNINQGDERIIATIQECSTLSEIAGQLFGEAAAAQLQDDALSVPQPDLLDPVTTTSQIDPRLRILTGSTSRSSVAGGHNFEQKTDLNELSQTSPSQGIKNDGSHQFSPASRYISPGATRSFGNLPTSSAIVANHSPRAH